MAPPHLHPRSRMTSSLFATTIAASFFVVALPHILPCPAPRRAFADGEMPRARARTERAGLETESEGDSTAETVRRVRRRRRVVEGGSEGEGNGSEVGIVEFRPGAGGEAGEDGRRTKGAKRECPVPKPGGILGDWLGFNAGGGDREKESGEGTRPGR